MACLGKGGCNSQTVTLTCEEATAVAPKVHRQLEDVEIQKAYKDYDRNCCQLCIGGAQVEIPGVLLVLLGQQRQIACLAVELWNSSKRMLAKFAPVSLANIVAHLCTPYLVLYEPSLLKSGIFYQPSYVVDGCTSVCSTIAPQAESPLQKTRINLICRGAYRGSFK